MQKYMFKLLINRGVYSEKKEMYSSIMKSTNIIPILFLVLILSACEKDLTNVNNPSIPECQANQMPQQVRSLNLINPTSSASTIPIIASFKLFQNLITYNNTSNCKNKTPNCAVKLVIKNTSEKKVLFDYTVNFTSGTNTWQYEGFSSMNANGIDSVGLISSNCGWISTSTITVTPGNISFQ
jgi:hypothetical protein